MKKVIVYYNPSCAFSAATVAFLMLRGADFEVVNLEQDEAAAERVERALGDRKLETPVVQIENDFHVAPPLSELKQLLEEEAGVPAEAAPHTQLST